MASKQTRVRPNKKPITKTVKKLSKRTKSSKEAVKAQAKKLAVGEEPKTELPDRVTSETVEAHRKEVLSASKRFIYPLTHSKHKVALISTALFVLVVVAIFGFTSLMLYRYQRTDDFAYRVSQIVPFPVARVDGRFVSYEDYLFEVRQNIHFYSVQENINFDDAEGAAILANIRSEALQRVKENAIAKKLASENGITVSDEEVQEQIVTIREQGGIGDSIESLENALSEFYNWTVEDFEEVMRTQLIKQKLISVLDTESQSRTQSLKNQLNEGADFAELAKANSDDLFSKDNGGQLGSINRATNDFPPVFVEAAFALEKDQVSEVVQSSVGLHIIRNLGVDPANEEQIKVAHILVSFKDIDELLRGELANVEVRDYISLEEQAVPDGMIESAPQRDDQR